MHIAKLYRPADFQAVLDAIMTTRFGTLVSHYRGEFDATPIPWVAERGDGDTLVLWGHLAKANPQLEALRAQPQGLVTFTGRNGYISPRGLHTPRSAPTWNYIAVHVHGAVELLDEAASEAAVEKLVVAMESGREQPWSSAEMESRREKLLRHVTGICVTAQRVEAKFKLGQNEREADWQRIVGNLEAEGRGDLAAAMCAADSGRRK